MDSRGLMIAGATLGILGIVFGAFGAHALKDILSEAQLVSFETGVRYQMYHALFLLFVARLDLPEKTSRWIFRLVLSGVILFSGSIYLLSTRDVTGIDIRPAGFITPIGGMLMISGWLTLLVAYLRKKS